MSCAWIVINQQSLSSEREAYGVAPLDLRDRLRSVGHTVTFLMTDRCPAGVSLLPHEYVMLEAQEDDRATHLPSALRMALRVHMFFQRCSADVIYFMAHASCAFHLLQARRMGMAHVTTRVVLVAWETIEYRLHVASAWNEQHTETTKICWCERYVFSRSNSLFLAPDLHSWLVEKKWNLPQNADYLKANSIEKLVELAEGTESSSEHILDDFPKISVCVAYYNHGDFLQETLESLALQDYPRFEVLVIDDGSSSIDSIAVFEKCAAQCDSRFRFFRKDNEGPGPTRNFAARQANGKYLVFFDADNIAKSTMLTELMQGLNTSGCALVGTHFLAVSLESTKENLCVVHRYAPTGADLCTGMITNTLGDITFIIDSLLFKSMQGFADTRHGCEDWEFLARAILAGYEYDVIPEPLFWYRLTGRGMRATMSYYHSYRQVLGAYQKALPSFAAQAYEHLLLPMYFGHSVNHSVIVRLFLKLGVFCETLYLRCFPEGSLRQRMMSKLYHYILSNDSVR